MSTPAQKQRQCERHETLQQKSAADGGDADAPGDEAAPRMSPMK